MTRRSIRSLTEVAWGVYLVEGPASNWVVLAGEGRVALIDAGYPADLPLVEESLRAVAGSARLTTILVTHAHSDHIGAIRGLLAAHAEARVRAGADELAGVRRDEVHQVTIADLLPHVWRPRVAAWAVSAVRAGGLADVGVPRVEAVPPTMVVAGHAVRAVATPGHTPGHVVYELPAAHAVATGDALVTGHAVTRRTGLQALHPMFHHDPRAAEDRARALADVYRDWIVLPGHGGLLPR
jgi:glyoxylase-like metal-dependent hydrolase (beta-lactamase superfamily II)